MQVVQHLCCPGWANVERGLPWFSSEHTQLRHFNLRGKTSSQFQTVFLKSQALFWMLTCKTEFKETRISIVQCIFADCPLSTLSGTKVPASNMWLLTLRCWWGRCLPQWWQCCLQCPHPRTWTQSWHKFLSQLPAHVDWGKQVMAQVFSRSSTYLEHLEWDCGLHLTPLFCSTHVWNEPVEVRSFQ